MRIGTALASAAIASVASAEYKPKVMNLAYAHQWDVVNVEGFNMLFASAYDIGVMTDVTKTNLKDAYQGQVQFNWMLRGFADWEIQWGMNIGDYFWFIFKSKGTGLDIRPINVHVTMPDWIDQYSWNSKHVQAPTCFGLDMNASFLNVVSSMHFNFKQIGISFLDVFNGMTATEIAAAEAEAAGEEVAEEEEEAPEEEAFEDDGFLLTKLRQEEAEDDCYEVDEMGELLFDADGNPIPCAEDHHSDSRQEEFAVERGEFKWEWVYKADTNPEITNLLQFPGFTFTWPLVNWCTPALAETRYTWMALLNAFSSKQWGNKEYYATS